MQWSAHLHGKQKSTQFESRMRHFLFFPILFLPICQNRLKSSNPFDGKLITWNHSFTNHGIDFSFEHSESCLTYCSLLFQFLRFSINLQEVCTYYTPIYSFLLCNTPYSQIEFRSMFVRRKNAYFGSILNTSKLILLKIELYVQGDKYVLERWAWHLNQWSHAPPPLFCMTFSIDKMNISVKFEGHRYNIKNNIKPSFSWSLCI